MTGSTELYLGRDDIAPGEVNLVVAARSTSPAPGFTGGVRVDGFEGRISGGSDPRICGALSAKALCVLTYWPRGDWPGRRRPGVGRARSGCLAEMIRWLTAARPRTWFDAEVALPR